MATLGFEVHTDKENAVSASVPRKGVKGLSAKPLGSRDQNKFPGPPVRKALQNVNQQVPVATSQGLNFAKNVVKDSIFTQSKGSNDIENMPVHGFVKKKSPALSKKGTQSSAQPKKKFKSKPSAAKTKVEVEPIPHIDVPNDEEYDSDSIFPRAERLSSYVDKLLMWRPPCLFGSIPDSDPEISDHEDELIIDEEICRMPINLSEVPEFPSPEDLSEDFLELPSLDLPKDEPEQQVNRLSPELLSDLSFNRSLPLGTLQMIPDSENVSGFEVNSASNFDGE